MNKPVFTPLDVEGYPMRPSASAETFESSIRSVGGALGLTGLGAMHVSVEPGKRAFPFHNHLGNDEMFVILEGQGTYRFGDTEHKIKAGDICGAPKGGPDTAHQLINTGETTLRYIGISTTQDPDICEYPDSGKLAAKSVFPGDNFQNAHMRHVSRREDGLDYWDGEVE